MDARHLDAIADLEALARLYYVRRREREHGGRLDGGDTGPIRRGRRDRGCGSAVDRAVAFHRGARMHSSCLR